MEAFSRPQATSSSKARSTANSARMPPMMGGNCGNSRRKLPLLPRPSPTAQLVVSM
jgi:hypothetical protein